MRNPSEVQTPDMARFGVFSEVKLGQYINSAEDLRKMGAD